MKIVAIENSGERTRLVPSLRERWRPRHRELFRLRENDCQVEEDRFGEPVETGRRGVRAQSGK